MVIKPISEYMEPNSRSGGLYLKYVGESVGNGLSMAQAMALAGSWVMGPFARYWW